MQEFHRQLPIGSVAVNCTSSTPTTPKQYGSALHKYDRRLPTRSVAEH